MDKQLQMNSLLRIIQPEWKWVNHKNKMPTFIVKLQKNDIVIMKLTQPNKKGKNGTKKKP